ncbi:response regulator [Paenibacillus cymbidii]|uniref:response regulator n=1 Tax=Paenibacillus cymbidii TaxID=1639034 RepID=UPI0014368314|nr:response regulator [Paenibacillus cymbidii]
MVMYRLLIVDDEADIVNSLYMFLQEIKGPELDIYRAYSAREALEWLDRTKMDIVLTDIRMPGMNGIQLLEHIRRNWPLCKVIFVTGYDEFEYAHVALKYGGVKYILKTEGYEEIERAVAGAVAEIENALQRDEWIDYAKRQMEAAVPLMQKEYLLDLLQGESYSAEERAHHFRQMGLPLRADTPVMLLAARLDNLPKTVPPMEKSRLIYAVKSAAESQLGPAVAHVGISFERSNLLWFVQPKEIAAPDAPSWEWMALFVKGTAETIQQMCLKTLNIAVSFVTDSEPTAWADVPGRYESLKQLVYYRFGQETTMRIVDRSEYAGNAQTAAPEERLQHQARQRLKQLKALEANLESGAADEFHALLADIASSFPDIHGHHHEAALATYYSISVMFLTYMERWNLAAAVAGRFDPNKLTRLDEHRSWQEAAAYFAGLADALFELRFHDEENRALAAVNTVKQFIHEHYGEDLSLVRLAQIVHFNPSYLSRLFKQVAGTNLLGYINEVRIDHAKRLLTESELKVHDIAKTVGYMSAPYFTRFFRRAVNMSPQEYREYAFKQVKQR